MLNAVVTVIKGISVAILGLCFGYLLADELSQRALRAELRDACITEYNSQLPPEVQDAMKNLVAFKCRSAIP